MPKLKESRRPTHGQQHTYALYPGPDPGCTVSWFINGQQVGLWDKVGGLEVKGFGAAGTMTVEVVEPDHVWHATEVTARIRCPEEPVVTVGPMLIGSVYWDPCEQEPCGSSRRRYRERATIATDAADGLGFFCHDFRMQLVVFLPALAIFIIAAIAAVLCRTWHLDDILCLAIYSALALATVLLLWALRRTIPAMIALNARLKACKEAKAAMTEAYQEMQARCPEECRLPEVAVECRCR